MSAPKGFLDPEAVLSKLRPRADEGGVIRPRTENPVGFLDPRTPSRMVIARIAWRPAFVPAGRLHEAIFRTGKPQ